MRSSFSGSSSEWFRQPAPAPKTKNPLPPWIPIIDMATVVKPAKLATVATAALMSPPVQPGVSLEEMKSWNQRVVQGKETGVYTVTLTISPALAKWILEFHNPGNRHPSLRWEIPRIKRAILEGNFQHNGETIKIATTGELNDGQNRLMACVEAGIAIKTEVTFGLTRESRKAVGIGVVRTIQHILQAQGYTNVVETGHGASLVLTYQFSGRFHSKNPTDRAPPDEIDRWLSEHDLREDVAASIRVYQQLPISKGVLAALHYFFRQIDPVATKLFFERLTTGVWSGVHTRDPVYRLREYIHTRGPFRNRAEHETLAAVTVKAFSAMRAGRKVTKLSWRSEGVGAEDFPVIE